MKRFKSKPEYIHAMPVSELMELVKGDYEKTPSWFKQLYELNKVKIEETGIILFLNNGPLPLNLDHTVILKDNQVVAMKSVDFLMYYEEIPELKVVKLPQ